MPLIVMGKDISLLLYTLPKKDKQSFEQTKWASRFYFAFSLVSRQVAKAPVFLPCSALCRNICCERSFQQKVPLTKGWLRYQIPHCIFINNHIIRKKWFPELRLENGTQAVIVNLVRIGVLSYLYMQYNYDIFVHYSQSKKLSQYQLQ